MRNLTSRETKCQTFTPAHKERAMKLHTELLPTNSFVVVVVVGSGAGKNTKYILFSCSVGAFLLAVQLTSIF